MRAVVPLYLISVALWPLAALAHPKGLVSVLFLLYMTACKANIHSGGEPMNAIPVLERPTMIVPRISKLDLTGLGWLSAPSQPMLGLSSQASP